MIIARKNHRAWLEILPDVVIKTYYDPPAAQWELSWYVSATRYTPPLIESWRGRLVMARGEPVTEPAPDELFAMLHDMQAEGIHHRDVWVGNLVTIGGELRLIDWETATHADTPSYDLYGPDVSGLPIPDIHAALRNYRMWWDSDHPQSISSLWGVHVSDMAAR